MSDSPDFFTRLRDSGLVPPSRDDWRDYVQEAINAKNGGEYQARSDIPTIGVDDADRIEAWAQAGIDAEIDTVETAVSGTRNDTLNRSALRCYRLAMLANFDHGDITDALVAAARQAGLDDNEIRATLKSAHGAADRQGPAGPPTEKSNMQEVPAHEINGSSGVPDTGPSRRATVTWASSIRPKRQIWLYQDRISVGTISALAGRGGTGKTTWAVDIVAQLSTGKLAGEFYGTPRNCLIWSGEDPWDKVLVPRLIAAGADRDRVGQLSIAEAVDGMSQEVTPKLPLDVAAFGAAIAETDAALVVIDPIASTMSGDLHREADVRTALDSLARVAAATGAVVMFVRHFGKGGGNATDKMSGNHAFRDACRSVFLFAADDESGLTVVSQDKGNYAADQESFAFRLEPVTVATDDGDTSVARVVDLGASEITVDDVINRQPGGSVEEFDEHDYADDFKTSWLYDYLAAAQKASAEVRPKDAVAVGADKGISRASVFRLFSKLANAGLAESVDGTAFPRVTHWRLISETTEGKNPGTESAATTETTGADLHKQDETTELPLSTSATTGETVSEQEQQVNGAPVVSAVSPDPHDTPPGGITGKTPGMTDRVTAILAKTAQQTRSSTEAANR